MKIYANLLALCAFQPVVAAFIVPTPSSQSTVLRSSPGGGGDYLSKLKGVSSGGQNMPGDARVRDMERALEQRLASLAQTEKTLESRLANLSQTEKSLQQKLGDAERSKLGAPRGGPGGVKGIDELWESSNPTTVQGRSLRTWSFANPAIDRVHVLLKTDGRPLDADIQLWQGPDNTPYKMKVYVEDGAMRTFSAFIDTPRGPNAICVKNTGYLEFPLYACVGPDKDVSAACMAATKGGKGEIIQGGALRTYPFGVAVDSVAVMIKTDGRPLNARIELLQGPNNNKQVLELYTEDGLVRPFLAVIQTPGSGNVVRIVNSAPVEFPMHATVVEYEVSDTDYYAMDGIQIGQEW